MVKKDNLINEYFDMLEHKSGKYHKYQYLVLLVGHLLFIDCFLTMYGSVLFSEKPSVEFRNLETGEISISKATKEFCKRKDVVILGISDFTRSGFSITTDFNFYCDDLINGYMNACMYGGNLLAMLLLSPMNNYFGRKITIISSLIVNTIVSILINFSPSTTAILLGLFLYSTIGMIAAQTAMLLNQENIVNNKRSMFVTLQQLGNILSMVIYDMMMYYANSWKIGFYFSAGFNIFIIFIVYFYILESCKFHMQNKDYEKYMLNLLNISIINKRKDKFLSYLIINKETLFLDMKLDKDNPFSNDDENDSNYKYLNSLLNDEDFKLLASSFNIDLDENKNNTLTKKLNLFESDNMVVNISENKMDKQKLEISNTSDEKFLFSLKNELNKGLENEDKESDEEDAETKRRKSLNKTVNASRKSNMNLTKSEMTAFGTFKIDFIEIRMYFGYKLTNEMLNNQDKRPSLIYVEDEVIEEKDKENLKEKENNTVLKSKTYNIIDLFTYKSQRLKFISLCVIWLLASGVYFGNTVNIKNLPGNILVNAMINAAVQATGMILSGVLMNLPILGRVISNRIYYIFSFIGYLLVAVVPASDTVKLILSFSVKIALTGSINTLFVLSGESYPNSVKNIAYGINVGIGKLGALILTFVIELLTNFQVNIIFSSLSLVTCFFFFLLEETLNKPLQTDIPELMENSHEDKK